MLHQSGHWVWPALASLFHVVGLTRSRDARNSLSWWANLDLRETNSAERECTSRLKRSNVSTAAWVVDHKKVERLMHDNGLQGVHKPAKVRTTIPASAEHPEVPDLLKRDFSTGSPDCRWVGDITYIPTGEGWGQRALAWDLRVFLSVSVVVTPTEPGRPSPVQAAPPSTT